MPSVGMGEVLLILTIAVIAVGPERLPNLVRQARRLFGELRQLATGVTDDLKREFDPARRELTIADLNLLPDLSPELSSMALAKVPAGLQVHGQLPPPPDPPPTDPPVADPPVADPAAAAAAAPAAAAEPSAGALERPAGAAAPMAAPGPPPAAPAAADPPKRP
jgi:Tat protein translocase TatB subunit